MILEPLGADVAALYCDRILPPDQRTFSGMGCWTRYPSRRLPVSRSGLGARSGPTGLKRSAQAANLGLLCGLDLTDVLGELAALCWRLRAVVVVADELRIARWSRLFQESNGSFVAQPGPFSLVNGIGRPHESQTAAR